MGGDGNSGITSAREQGPECFETLARPVFFLGHRRIEGILGGVHNSRIAVSQRPERATSRSNHGRSSMPAPADAFHGESHLVRQADNTEIAGCRLTVQGASSATTVLSPSPPRGSSRCPGRGPPGPEATAQRRAGRAGKPVVVLERQDQSVQFRHQFTHHGNDLAGRGVVLRSIDYESGQGGHPRGGRTRSARARAPRSGGGIPPQPESPLAGLFARSSARTRPQGIPGSPLVHHADAVRGRAIQQRPGIHGCRGRWPGTPTDHPKV